MKKMPKIKLPAAISRIGGRAVLKARKHSPEILIVTGVVAIGAGTVAACKATLKVEEVLDEHQETMKKIETTEEMHLEQYSAEDAKKDRAVLTIQTGAKLVKLYAPAAVLYIAGFTCIFASYGIMRKRNLALMAAYKALDEAFRDYRKRVVNERGENADTRYRLGTEDILTKNDMGKMETVPDVVDDHQVSMYARFFDELSPEYTRNHDYNLMFLNQVQNSANDLLNARGHVFLNEVYDMLGIPRTSPGAIVGWVKGHGDDYVDIGLYNVHREGSREFVNGYEKAILLDFNVDGVIYDLI